MSSSGVKEFGFTKCAPETFTLVPGSYKLEVWGASGGTFGSSPATGGPGGYAKGVLTLTEETTVFVRVGSQGSNSSYGSGSQGCNGGGYTTHSGGRSGGGATDIRLKTDSLYSRILVAGGGGGSSDQTTDLGGCGGGISGGNGEDSPSIAGKGGGQNGETLLCADGIATNCPKGIFGFGGNTSGSWAGGGGGGWYGGSASNNEEGGGGGSGYALTSSSYKPSSYLLKDSKYYLKEVVLLGGNESIPNPIGGGNIIGRMGDGYARITPICILPSPPSAPSLLNFSFYGNELEIKDELRKFNFNVPGNYSSEVIAGTYQFNSTGAFCGTSIVSEYEFKRSVTMRVSILQNATIYINDELFLNVPSEQQKTDAFVFPGMKTFQKYNASEFQCTATYYAIMSITFIPPASKMHTCKQKYTHCSLLFFIYTIVDS